MFSEELLSGFSDVEHATQLLAEIVATLIIACFDIRKWRWSVSPLDEQFPSILCKYSNNLIICSDNYTIKTLGINWSPSTDCVNFANSTVCLVKELPNIQRKIMSENVWSPWSVVSTNNSVAINRTTSLDGPANPGQIYLVKYSRTISILIDRAEKDSTLTKIFL